MILGVSCLILFWYFGFIFSWVVNCRILLLIVGGVIKSGFSGINLIFFMLVFIWMLVMVFFFVVLGVWGWFIKINLVLLFISVSSKLIRSGSFDDLGLGGFVMVLVMINFFLWIFMF